MHHRQGAARGSAAALLGRLTNAVPQEDIEQLLGKGSFYDLPDRLVDTADENGGPDNITALLLGVEPLEVRHG